MTKEVQPTRKLDCLGLYCPEPVFRTRTEIEKMQIGEILEVTADDPAAEEDIQRLVKRLGQQILGVHKEDGKLRIIIKRTS